MKTRIITALVLVAVILPCVIIGGICFKIIIALLLGGAVYEMLSICKSPKVKPYIYILLSIFSFYVVFFEKNLVVPSTIIMLFLLVLFALSMFDEELTLYRLCYYFAMNLLIAFGFHSLLYTRITLGLEYVILLALATFGSDTGAYFVGVMFGKHKLNPRLSPKKTIEGSIGGIVLGTIASVLYGYLAGIDITMLHLVIVCALLTVTGQIGDLTFSSVKRTFEVKDYSNIFPGHGGVLDRFDSILFNAVVLGIFLSLVGMVI